MLRDYDRGTGQLLSPATCCLMIVQKWSEEDSEAVATILNIGSMTLDDKYLGFPVPEGTIKMANSSPPKKSSLNVARTGMKSTSRERKRSCWLIL